MKIVIFGLTITSAWGNGHATTYRSLVKALSARGHRVVFVEKDVEWYRNHRDLPEPGFCTLAFYEDWTTAQVQMLHLCHDADAIVVGSYFPDAKLAVSALVEAGLGPLLFYDIDTPITLRGLRENGEVPYLDKAMVPHFDVYLSFTGGPALEELEQVFGASRAIAFYCSVDPDLYKPSAMQAEFRCDLSYLGTFAPDRQAKLMHLLNEPAGRLPGQRFIVAGAMYPEATEWAANVVRFAHVGPPSHPAFYSSSRFTLNLTRSDMVIAGHSPSVRLFEASACAAVTISDSWAGLEDLLSPGVEILVPGDAHEVTDILLYLSEAERRQMGKRARERILDQHTSRHRAMQFEEIIASVAPHPGPERVLETRIDRELAQPFPVAAAYTRL